MNGWEHLAQEVLISTPRRFGKTISVSMFAAAMMWGAPSVEISIYSTCKRISQKLLRNCVKFFYEVCKQDLAAAGFKVVRQNMEEIVLRGPGGERDVRVVNSYPSKVGAAAAVPKVSLRAPRARRVRAKSLSACCARQKSACVLREERTGRDAPQHQESACACLLPCAHSRHSDPEISSAGVYKTAHVPHTTHQHVVVCSGFGAQDQTHCASPRQHLGN